MALVDDLEDELVKAEILLSQLRSDSNAMRRKVIRRETCEVIRQAELLIRGFQTKVNEIRIELDRLAPVRTSPTKVRQTPEPK
jgi:hypothetical protein